jgi:TPR repeat protein
MRNLSAPLCLTIVVLFGSVGCSNNLQKGLSAYISGDYATALREWKPLAKQGYANAQYNLGLMYRKGQGVIQDYKTAVKWWKLSAKQGNARAQINLGVMYEKGQGVPQDYKTAVKWYRLAAEQGKAKAQSNLGVMYQFGTGVSQNYEEAARWYELAANQGNSTAQKQLGAVYVSLGKMLRENNVTCKNLNACGEALEFYYKAAELGNGDAMILIPNVLMFLNENTMSEIDKLKNKQKMVMWWILGMEVGNTDPELTKNTEVVLNGIKKQSTLFAIGEKLARECVRKNYKGC